MSDSLTREFILRHRNDDVRQLALSADRNKDIDVPFALSQIAGWQTARVKLPSWAQTEGIIYPRHLSMEQCSSEETARYKAGLLSNGGEGEPGCKLQGANYEDGVTLLDLTGGLAVDFSFLAKALSRDGTGCIYVERSSELCDIARNNLPLLSLPQAKVLCADAADILTTISHASVIFIDPARRDSNGARTYAIADCTPNVAELCDKLLSRADTVVIKLSPMLDWHKAVADLNCVRQVHIVSVNNECKELLLVLRQHPPCGSSRTEASPLLISCVNLPYSHHFVYSLSQSSPHDEDNKNILTATDLDSLGEGCFLYEPNSSIMKAGCFRELSHRFDVSPVGPNSHLFTSRSNITSFPGRSFRILAVSTMNKRELKVALQGITSANIAVRNFPLSVADLRKRLRLKDGGETYIFATTATDNRHLLFICSKA